MKIIFSPARGAGALSLSRAGDVLTVNGEVLDFSDLPAGGVLPREALACAWIARDVTRDAAGRLTVPLILPHAADARQETRFPESLLLEGDGPVQVPGQGGPGSDPGAAG